MMVSALLYGVAATATTAVLAGPVAGYLVSVLVGLPLGALVARNRFTTSRRR